MSSLFVDNNGNRDWKKIWYHARSAFAVLLSFAVLIGGAYVVYDKANQAYVSWKTEDDYQGPGGKKVQITIDEESTGNDIANVLLDADIIKSRKSFQKAYAANEQAKKIQPGLYNLPIQIPASTAIEYLLDNKHVVRNQVTIPEALWLSQQFAILSKHTKIPVAEFEKVCQKPQSIGLPSYVENCEGFLFPETYEIGQKPTAQSILKQMAEQFNVVAKRNDLAGKADKLDRTPLQVITLASILEAEAQEKDMPMVAGIIYNRLSKDRKLQLDSTSYYATKTPLGKPLPAGFTEIDSPYNTYMRYGLPPGPIGAPGEKAIKAALNPVKTDNLFWVTVNFDTKETKFTKDEKEHLKNVEQWKNWCKTAKNKSGCPTS